MLTGVIHTLETAKINLLHNKENVHDFGTYNYQSRIID